MRYLANQMLGQMGQAPSPSPTRTYGERLAKKSGLGAPGDLHDVRAVGKKGAQLVCKGKDCEECCGFLKSFALSMDPFDPQWEGGGEEVSAYYHALYEGCIVGCANLAKPGPVQPRPLPGMPGPTMPLPVPQNQFATTQMAQMYGFGQPLPNTPSPAFAWIFRNALPIMVIGAIAAAAIVIPAAERSKTK